MVDLLNVLNYNLFFLVTIFILCLFIIITGLLIILVETPVHSVMGLMFIFLFLTELALIFQLEFIAFIFVIVYIGAVCIFMLFHVKLLYTFVPTHYFSDKEDNIASLVACFIIPIIQIITLILYKSEYESLKELKLYSYSIYFAPIFKFQKVNYNFYNFYSFYEFFETITTTQILGYLLYNVYYIYLIIGSLLLFVAMVGTIRLAIQENTVKLKQSLRDQIFLEISTSLRKRESF